MVGKSRRAECRLAPLLFTANDCLDIGTDLGSPVSVDYYDQAPFNFIGKIEQVKVKYLGSPAEMQEEKRQERLRIDGQARERLAEFRAMPKPLPATKRNAAWHKAHGFAWSGKYWVAEILLRSQRDHEEFILAEREFKRVQRLELACLTYGPQRHCHVNHAQAQ